MITTPLDPKVKHRLTTESNIWLATVRADNTPHLVPIWFVWVEGKAYVCTAADSVKARNMRGKPNVAFALENGNAPVVLEGCARFAPIEVCAARRDRGVSAQIRLGYSNRHHLQSSDRN